MSGLPLGRRLPVAGRRGRRLASGVVLLVVSFAAACGVTAQRTPQPVVPYQVPNTATPRPQVTRVVQVYLLRGGRLVPVTRSGSSIDDAIASLSAGPTDLDAEADLETRIPPRSVRLAPTQDPNAVVLDVTRAFTTLPDQDRFLAAAQLVWTATAFCCGTGVRVRLENRELVLPTDAGAIARPVRRDDYRSVAPA